MSAPHQPSPARLERELGVFGTTMMGLGAMMGTGVFVSIGIAAGVSGPSVVPAIVVAALVAVCNALSSAQLAASHAVSGGTYEYGYKYLTPALGFSAGWMFLCAKSASAATAALGFGGYFLHLFGGGSLTIVAMVVAIAVTLLVLKGTRMSSLANVAVVSVTLIALGLFVAFTIPAAAASGREHLFPILPEQESFGGFLQACALMFVAYTGYGRIATLGEEVKDPRRAIPAAILAVMAISAVIYVAVGIAAIGAYGAESLGASTREAAAPLETVLRALGHPGVAGLVGIGAMTAMLGVLLNLVLGLSRVALAMARRGDLPAPLARLNARKTTPPFAVVAVGAVVTSLVLLGNVEVTWSFSAFTVLVYYALTNLAALRLPKADRLYPPIFAWCGLFSCAFLAFWVDATVWISGLGLLGLGLVWHFALRRIRAAR